MNDHRRIVVPEDDALGFERPAPPVPEDDGRARPLEA